MEFIRVPVLLAAMTVASVAASASELDLALSEDTAAAELIVGSEFTNMTSGNVTIGGEYNDDDDLLGYIGISSGGSNTFGRSAQPVEFGVGGRLYYASVDQPDQSASAIALGGHGRVNLTTGGLPVALAGSLYFAPDITTFMDGDDFIDARVRLEADISPNATAFVGYRNVEVGLKSFADHKIDDNIHAGVRFKF